jgi:hypothetical protein
MARSPAESPLRLESVADMGMMKIVEGATKSVPG